MGEFIRNERIKREIGTRRLARQVNVVSSYLTDIEKGRRVPSEEVLARIAGAIDVNLDDLMKLAGRTGSQATGPLILTDDPPEIGSLIRSIRLRRGVGGSELARHIGISPSYLADIEKGRRSPSEKVLRGLADATEVDFDYLMALSGKLGNRIEQYIEKHPAAFTLLQKIAEANLDDDGLAKLSDTLNDIKKSQNPSSGE